MYASHFGLSQSPFSIAPDPRYLCMSERHREALAHLLYGLNGGGGFVLLTGEIGAGKTTVCRCFLEQLPAHCNVAYIFNPKLSVAELLRSIGDEFHLPLPEPASSVKDFVDPLNRFLLTAHAAGQNNVLIIDEAQNLAPDVLEQLRLLTNLETAERKLLQIILIGQPELRELLAQPALEQLAQRVIARFHLSPLDEPETRHYILHRLTVAGLRGPSPFSASAERLVYRLSGGVPRRVNLLCDRALLGAYAQGKHQVSASLVRQAAAEVFDKQRPSRTTGSRWPMALGWIGGVAAGAAALWIWQAQPRHAEPAALLALPSARPSPAPSSPPPSAVASAVPAEALPNVIAARDLPRSASLDGSELARLWHTEWPADEAPCPSAAARGLACYHQVSGSLSLIRQLNRPVALTLHGQDAGTFSVLLTGIDTEFAWILGPAGSTVRLPLSELATLWRGEMHTLWRWPAMVASPSPAPAVSLDTLAMRAWLTARLDQLPGVAPAASVQVPPLAERLRSFQAAQGLQPDGRIGPITLMQLNHATGVDEPRLSPLR
jgi:general secretion pathway protein A